MEVVVDAAAPPPPSQNTDIIAKGKRTKRQRPHSPSPVTITTATHNLNNNENGPSFTAAASSSAEDSTTTEEVDTARFLILLSRGYFSNKHNVYTCKTCNRSFSSFQALGGHRTSHKKPRNEKRATPFFDENDFLSPSSNRLSINPLSLQLSNASTATFVSASLAKLSPSPRIHECSYCGAEFTSGQALGGHMRKHRAGPVVRSLDMIVEAVEPRESKRLIVLSLDLNLPAHDDEKEKARRELIRG